jgi:hypothetical protein
VNTDRQLRAALYLFAAASLLLSLALWLAARLLLDR